MVSDTEYTFQMIYLKDTKFNEQKPKVQNPVHGEVHSMQLYVINVCQWRAAVWWFSPFSSTNKTDRQDITEILLKVTLITITPITLRCNIHTDVSKTKYIAELFLSNRTLQIQKCTNTSKRKNALKTQTPTKLDDTNSHKK